MKYYLKAIIGYIFLKCSFSILIAALPSNSYVIADEILRTLNLTEATNAICLAIFIYFVLGIVFCILFKKDIVYLIEFVEGVFNGKRKH